jgi:hypothetical protein
MISFCLFWIKRISNNYNPLIQPEPHQSIKYLNDIGWRPDYNFLSRSPKKMKAEYLSKINREV